MHFYRGVHFVQSLGQKIPTEVLELVVVVYAKAIMFFSIQ